MTIHDINYLKNNSEMKSHKIHMRTSTSELPDIFQNVYAMHILSVFTPPDSVIEEPLQVTLYANDIVMDSILVHSTGQIDNTVGLEYENSVHPLAKVSYVDFRANTLGSATHVQSDMYVTFLIRYFSPITDFAENKYLELNPQYNPHIIPDDFSETGSDEEY
jgi:hypothetical protein